MIWYKELSDDIVVSTRVRLARNLDRVPFPAVLKDKKEIIDKIKASVLSSNSVLSNMFDFVDLDTLSDDEKAAMTEEHLISPQMQTGKDHSVMISKDKTMSIMLMEEDHIRLQIILGGFELDKAYETADRVDDVMEENLTYAFDESFGYLTACPTNAGTGMRASVMMHLPALTMTDNISSIISSAGRIGIAVRGLYGEGSKAYGNLYQISNQITMGMSEREILDKLKTVVNQIIDAEKRARDLLMKNSRTELEDKLSRSYGILKYAKQLSSKEAMALLSDVLLGQDLGVIPKDGKVTPIECMIKSAPSIIGSKLSAQERDIKRAEYVKNNI